MQFLLNRFYMSSEENAILCLTFIFHVGKKILMRYSISIQ